MNSERLLERFLSYVQIDTTAVEDSGKYPSSDGQLELGKLLKSQLESIGLVDVSQNSHGIVMGTIPGNVPGAPVIAFNAHVDTSPETTGKNVKPQIIRDFDGQDITLSGDSSKVVTSATCPELLDAAGKTIITTDGTTLLGGDDKAGVAIIMELANYLMENPEVPRGDVRVLYTCDEEIGHGVDHVDIDAVGAVACYTFDGGGQDCVDNETFSADMACVEFIGVNIHPAIAKDKMINSMRAAGHFISQLPANLAPETTDGRDGFLHPYVLDGGVAKTTMKILIRDFDTGKLEQHASVLREALKATQAAFPDTQINMEIVKQYRNMADGLSKEPRALEFALKAHENLGRTPQKTIIRGGTDGSRLTELGLPTPNLSSGQHNIHSPLEWACLDEMAAACEVGIEIVKLWATA